MTTGSLSFDECRLARLVQARASSERSETDGGGAHEAGVLVERRLDAQRGWYSRTKKGYLHLGPPIAPLMADREGIRSLRYRLIVNMPPLVVSFLLALLIPGLTAFLPASRC